MKNGQYIKLNLLGLLLFTLCVIPGCALAPLIPLGIVYVVPPGAGLIYGTVVDERDFKTITKDTAIKTSIFSKFLTDEHIKILDISASCYLGHVYLIGEYDTKSQKKRAIEIAKTVDGVNGVTAILEKKEDCPSGQSITITAKIKARLIQDKDIWSTNVDIKTLRCSNVVLWGIIGSKLEAKDIVYHAEQVKGVESVRSLLIVKK